jgi:hypothetical protein
VQQPAPHCLPQVALVAHLQGTQSKGSRHTTRMHPSGNTAKCPGTGRSRK